MGTNVARCRVSLAIAFISVICNVFIGIVYGSIAGYYGGKIDMVMMRITEIIGAFPEIVVVTLFILFFGTGMLSIILCLVVQNWIGTARMIRSQFYRYKGSEYVLAARTLGVKDMALIFRHILPNSIGPIITRAMIAIPGAILPSLSWHISDLASVHRKARSVSFYPRDRRSCSSIRTRCFSRQL